MTRDSKKSTATGSPTSSVYQKAKYGGSDNTISRHAIEVAKSDLVSKIRDDNPLERAGDIIGRMSGFITKSEVDEIMNAAMKELAGEVGLDDFADSEVFRAGDRDMISSAKRSLGAYRYHDDPPADAKKGLRILYDQASESEIEEALRIARKEYEFQDRVKKRYDLIRERRIKLRAERRLASKISQTSNRSIVPSVQIESKDADPRRWPVSA